MKNQKHEKLVLKMFSPYQIKSKLGTYVRQILHGHSAGFHFLISLLTFSRDSLFLGIYSKIFGPKYDADSVPL